MKAIIITGGKGERLRPLTDFIPKPMICLAGKPILEHIINLLKKYSIKEFVMTLCYFPEKVTSYFGDGLKFGVKINYIYEDPKKPLGTAGGIAQSAKYLDGDFIVTSGDILRRLNIKKMISFHERKNAFATVNVYKRFGPDPKSMISFDTENTIKKFTERPKLIRIKSDFVWSNGSFYIFNKGILDYIPKNKKSDFGSDIFPLLIKYKKRVFAYPSDGYFIDVGNQKNLEKAKKTYFF